MLLILYPYDSNDDVFLRNYADKDVCRRVKKARTHCICAVPLDSREKERFSIEKSLIEI